MSTLLFRKMGDGRDALQFLEPPPSCREGPGSPAGRPAGEGLSAIAPTILQLMGLHKPDGMGGRSLLLMRG